MSTIADIITFFAHTVAVIFSVLDTVQFGDLGVSLLDVFIAILLLDLIVWYIQRILLPKDDEGEDTNEQ